MPSILKTRDDSWCSKWNHQDLNQESSVHNTAPLPLHNANLCKKKNFQVTRFTFCFKEDKYSKKMLIFQCICQFDGRNMLHCMFFLVIIIISRLHWLDHFIYTVKSWVPCSWIKKISKNWYAQFCNKEDKELADLQVPHRVYWGKCRGFKRQNVQPAQMYSLGSYETNAPHLCFFHKESIDVTPLKFRNAMCLSNLFFYKATFTVWMYDLPEFQVRRMCKDRFLAQLEKKQAILVSGNKISKFSPGHFSCLSSLCLACPSPPSPSRKKAAVWRAASPSSWLTMAILTKTSKTLITAFSPLLKLSNITAEHSVKAGPSSEDVSRTST
jgi:hypothetical protein